VRRINCQVTPLSLFIRTHPFPTTPWSTLRYLLAIDPSVAAGTRVSPRQSTVQPEQQKWIEEFLVQFSSSGTHPQEEYVHCSSHTCGRRTSEAASFQSVVDGNPQLRPQPICCRLWVSSNNAWAAPPLMRRDFR